MTSDLQYAGIPEELKERRQWVCYRIEERKGKKTKIPYRTDRVGRDKAKTNDPTTWHTFEEVLEALNKPKNRFDGIGYVLSEDDPYVFVDFDHVVDDGVTEEWADKIISKMDSYTEYSQSGTGIHIIARAKKPGVRCRSAKCPKFEIYESKRLAVFTGKTYPGSPGIVNDSQDAVNKVYLEMFGDGTTDPPTIEVCRDARSVGTPDSVLIEKAMCAVNGDKFMRLWNGDISDYCGDDSAADIALCCMLAFWTQRDPTRMDSLFRQSGLMRDKWDEKRGARTYGQLTIDNAIRQTSAVYEEPSARHERGVITDEELVVAREKIAEAKAAGTAAAIFDAAESLALLSLGEYADVTREMKEAVPQLDLRELKGHVSRARKSKRYEATGKYHEIVVNDRQLRDIGDEAIRELIISNVPPTLFVRSGALCLVVPDEHGRPMIRLVNEDILTTRLAKICDFVTHTDDGPRNAMPPRSIASYILSDSCTTFPALSGITRSPTIRPDGSIAYLPGYDPETELFYHQLPGEQVVEVPENPTAKSIGEAMKLIDELLCDFPFDCQASKANMVALLLSPLIQSAIADVMPLALIDAPTAGSGKSLLATVVGIICSGAAPDFITAPVKDDEWTKKITALLSSGPSLVIIDNLNHTLQNADLASMLTSRVWQDRVFGKNTETTLLPNRAAWVATGNNIQLGGDISRRCYWIRIDPELAKPHERQGFLHPDLTMWVAKNRSCLLGALLTIGRAWFAAGQPDYPVPPFGSFGRWAKTVGGILAHAGVEGFLQNRDKLWEQADTESTEWEAFLITWLEVYGNAPVTPKQLLHDMEYGGQMSESVPASIADALHFSGDICSKIGYQLKARHGKRYGSAGLRLERGPRRNTGVTWTVMVDSCPSESSSGADPTLISEDR